LKRVYHSLLVICRYESVDGRLIAVNRRPWGGDVTFLRRGLEPAWGPHGSVRTQREVWHWTSACAAI